MEGMADLPQEQQQQLLQKIEEMQVRDRYGLLLNCEWLLTVPKLCIRIRQTQSAVLPFSHFLRIYVHLQLVDQHMGEHLQKNACFLTAHMKY